MQKKSYIYALSAVFLWSSVATAFKLSLQYLKPIELVFYASIYSWFILAVLSFTTKEIYELKKLNFQKILSMLLLGVLNPFLYYLVLFNAYDILKAQEAQAINYTWALTFSYLSALIFKQKLSKYDIISGLICYMGVFVIATKGTLSLEFSRVDGVLLAFISTILWAFYWILSKKYNTYPTLGLFLNFTSGLIFITLYISFTQNIHLPSFKALLGSMYIGFFEMGFTFFLWLKALHYAKNTAKIANLIFISPFLSLVFIYLFLGEKILPSTLIGLSLIIVGLFYQQKAKS